MIFSRALSRLCLVVPLIGLCLTAVPSAYALTFKAAHGHGDGMDDVRQRVIEVMAKTLAQSRSGLAIKIYPRGKLFELEDLWTGLTGGTLEIANLPLARLRALDPVFAAPTLPGLAQSVDEAYGLAATPMMAAVRGALAQRGMRVLADIWLPGALVFSGRSCLADPPALAGRTVAAGGRLLGDLAVGQGARASALDEGRGRALLRALPDLVAVLPEVDVLTTLSPAPPACVLLAEGAGAWFDYQPVIVSEAALARLTPAQRAALDEAAAAAELYGRRAQDKGPQARGAILEKRGLTWAVPTAAEAEAWAALGKPLLSTLVGRGTSAATAPPDRPLPGTVPPATPGSSFLRGLGP
ncbi:C4-dicarboxylate ABC transporter substrate-binding protein [Rhodospirillum rubrum]|uniref:TRAP-type C4-dicarboxylate transport system periplasmic component-like n=1 Tax=Rhodospirillum rubrum (strain ATCC 11170 / ATH 1.1.1 / DSM 467 / LMG 4362 / NCIMB 8255 / S1) TaxID=269796 RepID=Q2RTA6_RHORT|nr:C4-dicarboxylate ABC transporter substrate-binding protein [Rhodospirillum rubrum]ABC22639.1 TRAP-type C4-dicarboxylate transport system periplasmic component-like [Rhodospirillum rubrum ATCC 11170]AEO48357.1 TRAP-type C4-dicarboxylate transport system periplasmic component-like protein [Rhodospirillum rubrum F11]MBK5954236.1 C4-dicarboxylate ABC transporter substrate-binding protein [Rhodospirillum rubrum]QXG82261.1 C4-dicarboxylate ABC transporter substrate-binding protein [Rhodospirillum 